MHEEHRDRHIIGPILLILAGVGLLLEQFGMLSIQWGSLWQYWPVLLILLGLDILLGRSRVGALLVVIVTIAAVAVIAVGAPIPWIEPHGELQVETLEYPLDRIKEGEIRIKPGVGRVEIDALHDDSDSFAEIVIEQDERRSSYMADMVTTSRSAELWLESTDKASGSLQRTDSSRWALALHPEPALELYLDGGVGTSDYDLLDLNLLKLDMNVGIGDINVTLPDQGLYEVDIDGGIGRVTVYVPDGLPVQIDVDGGIGRTDVSERFSKVGNLYVTDTWEHDKDTVKIDIDGGIGSIAVR